MSAFDEIQIPNPQNLQCTSKRSLWKCTLCNMLFCQGLELTTLLQDGTVLSEVSKDTALSGVVMEAI